jgi:hypothetical protein
MEAWAADFRCPVTHKLAELHQYTEEELVRGQFPVLIEERGDVVYVSRCSYAQSVQRVTCDRFEIVRVVRDPYIAAKKYYEFRSQADVHVFSDLSFVENNGRGLIAYGKCEIVSP